jgi:hypothetical protein
MKGVQEIVKNASQMVNAKKYAMVVIMSAVL